jgi:phage terminase Nu1 subunit (DNA packaging protein)
MAETNPGVVPVDVVRLGAIVGLDKRTIQRHAEAGIFVKIAHGKYDLFQSVKNYCEHLRSMAAGRQSKDGEIDAVTENALLKRTSRRLMEIKMEQVAGRLISIPELEELWGVHIRGVKQMVLAWPDRCAFELPHLTPHDIKVLKRTAEEVLRNNTLASAEAAPVPSSNGVDD